MDCIGSLSVAVQASEELPAAATAAEVPATPAPALAAAAAVPKPSSGGGKPSGRMGKHIGAPVAKSRVQVNRRKGTLQRVLAYAQQQLPKSLMHRLVLRPPFSGVFLSSLCSVCENRREKSSCHEYLPHLADRGRALRCKCNRNMRSLALLIGCFFTLTEVLVL